MIKVNVGDVYVTSDDCVNPYTYTGPLKSGRERALALARFRDGKDTTGMMLWHAPMSGGARRITAEEVAW